MKSVIAFLISCSLIVSFSACTKRLRGSGEYTTEQRSIGVFDGVESLGSFDVIIIPGSQPALSITAEDNIISEIQTVVDDDGILKIRFRRNVNVKHGDITITATTNTLKFLSLAGSGTIKPQGMWKSNAFTCNLSGSGSIIATTDAGMLKASVSGSGNVTLSGHATMADYSVSGSGNIRGYQMETSEADVSVNGSGNAEILVVDKLHANITGSGKIFYKGNPREVTQQVTGSGRVVKQ
jgi:putative autotransporter adhesin-like protein